MIKQTNKRPYIILNNKSSKSVNGLLITDLPPISKPLMRTLEDIVDGRDGDIITPLGYSAYDKVVKIALTYGYNVDDIIAFFSGSGRVVFGNEPDKFYNYSIYEQFDLERLINFKTGEVTFHCQPFKYSDEDNKRTYTFEDSPRSINIRNNGNIYSRPKLTLTGSGNVYISLNGVSLLSLTLGATTQTIIIDSVEMNAISPSGVLLNRLVSGNYDNIRLKTGSNELDIIGEVERVIIEDFSRWI